MNVTIYADFVRVTLAALWLVNFIIKAYVTRENKRKMVFFAALSLVFPLAIVAGMVVYAGASNFILLCDGFLFLIIIFLGISLRSDP